MEAWGFFVGCDHVEAFQQYVHALEVVCSPRPIFVEYVNGT